MASINLSGVLKDPEGSPDVGAIVKFTLLSTTGDTVKSSVSELIVPPDGLYNIDLVYGLVRVDYITGRKERFVAIITVNADTVATSIPELLNASSPPTRPQLLQFQSILADAVAAKDQAEASASEFLSQKLTASELIFSANSFPVGFVINTLGYDEIADGGSGKWVKTAATSTPNQSPSDRANATLTDSIGAVWQYVAASGYLLLDAIGAKGDGISDNTGVFFAAVNSGIRHHKAIGGTYLCDTYPLESGLCIEGMAGNKPVIKLNNSANLTVMYGENKSNVKIKNLVIDGNKANQGLGTANNNRGIYFLGVCHDILIDNVIVKDVTDHGIFFSNGGVVSNECGKNSTVINTTVTGCGSQAHSNAGGAGGSGVVGGQRSTHFVSCRAYQNYLNGFKSNGTHTGCESYENSGGGYETGFGSPATTQAKWVQCSATNNGGTGWRNQGEGDELTWVGCLARGNGRSGILLLNAVSRAVITSSWFAENGQLSSLESRSDTEGFDGITITGTSSNPNDIIINDCQFYDDQVTKTQEYHIYMRKETPNVSVGDNNIFSDAKIQPFYAELDAQQSNIKLGKCFGLSTYVNNTTPAQTAALTSTQVLTDHLVDQRSFVSSNRLRLTLSGEASGVSGTKSIRIQIAGIVREMALFASGETGAYYVKAEIIRHGSIAYIQYKCCIEGSAVVSQGLFTSPTSFSDNMIVKSIVQLTSSSDSVTQNRFTLEQV